MTESLERYPGVDDWIVIKPDGRVTVRTGKVDIGQWISTALALIVAEELDVDFTRIDVDKIDTAGSLDEEYTSASNSIQLSGQSLRLAAATARRHLVELAARALDVEPASVEVRDGLVSSRSSNRSTTYWDLIGGRRFDIAVDTATEPKAPGAYRQIGRSITAIGLADLVGGIAPFVHDMAMPGMLHARLVRPPHYHARVAKIDESVIKGLSDIRFVRNASFIAVAAADEYKAIQAAARVAKAVRWSPERGLDTRDIYERLVSDPRVSLPVDDSGAVEAPVPPLEAPPAEAVATLDLRIERPYLSHGSIGPSAALALFENGTLTIWTHTQGVYPLRLTIAESLAMDPSAVRLVHRRGPGTYGHNGADDAALDAALIAREIPGKPILLKWSREDEHAWEPYGPAMVVEVRASLGSDGRVIDWSHETFSDTHRTRPRPGPNQIGPRRMISTQLIENPVPPFVPEPFLSGPLAGIHRNAIPYYSFPRRRVVKNLVRGMPLRTSTLRTLGAHMNVFGIETMMDELSAAAGIDPLEFRLRQLNDPRAHAVLKSVTERVGWGGAARAPGQGRGLAFARYNNRKAYAAVVVDLEVDDAAKVRVHRVAIAVDTGQIIDHDGLALQLEGAILQAVSWTLYERVTFDENGITSRDWDTYPILRFDNAPDIETILIDRPGEPYLGPSECGLAPTAAAIANAIHDATGLRPRRLPFTPDALRATAMA